MHFATNFGLNVSQARVSAFDTGLVALRLSIARTRMAHWWRVSIRGLGTGGLSMPVLIVFYVVAVLSLAAVALVIGTWPIRILLCRYGAHDWVSDGHRSNSRDYDWCRRWFCKARRQSE